MTSCARHAHAVSLCKQLQLVRRCRESAFLSFLLFRLFFSFFFEVSVSGIWIYAAVAPPAQLRRAGVIAKFENAKRVTGRRQFICWWAESRGES